MENLFCAWEEFKRGKSKRKDVQEFAKDFKNAIFILHQELKNKEYKHSDYYAFYVEDPKLRHIHKANVRDRVLHRAVFRKLYSVFDKSFVFDSYSCRINKGTHRAVNRLQEFLKKVSGNNAKKCYVLKCDVRKFFDSIDQDILISLIKKRVRDKNAIWLINMIIKSFGHGLPLGNITSQLFANVYLNELDQFMKHSLRIKYYIRYCDDFIILSGDKRYLESLIPPIDGFLSERLKLILHPGKIILRKYSHGIDFLGYVAFPNFRILRSKTKNRIITKIKENLLHARENPERTKHFNQSLVSYWGVLKHCKSYKIKEEIRKIIYVNRYPRALKFPGF